jgi:hypothetical protein
MAPEANSVFSLLVEAVAVGIGGCYRNCGCNQSNCSRSCSHRCGACI